MLHTVYCALGSNLGDRYANLQDAKDALSPQVNILASSPIYETPPWGYTQQPAFLNQVIKAETKLEPLDLLHFFKRIEKDLGRVATFRNGPRLIDMDILFYDDLSLDGPELVIPHPRLQDRAFVLVPLADLCPDFYHHNSSLSVRAMLAKMDTNGIKLYEPCREHIPNVQHFYTETKPSRPSGGR